MNLKITQKENAEYRTSVINNVKYFEFFMVDNIPCLSIWYDQNKNPNENDYTIPHVIYFENIS